MIRPAPLVAIDAAAALSGLRGRDLQKVRLWVSGRRHVGAHVQLAKIG